MTVVETAVSSVRERRVPAPAAKPLLEVRGLRMHFPITEGMVMRRQIADVKAVDGVDLTIGRGETLGLVGESGCGKTTMGRCILRLEKPTAGEIIWEGRPVALQSPVDARSLGIGMVFQHFSLFDDLTVAENVAVALPHMSFSAVRERLEAVSREFGFALDPERAVWTLSAGERQRIEIVRCLLQEPKLLILDEPTSVLTPQEAETLFVTLERLSAAGLAD